MASKFYKVEGLTNGEIRVSAELFPEEKRHGLVMRGFTAKEAREMAEQLLTAAKRAGG